MPRFEDIRDEFPKELGSSVFFSADFFKPPESKGEATWTPRCPAVRGVGASEGPVRRNRTVPSSGACCVPACHTRALRTGPPRGVSWRQSPCHGRASPAGARLTRAVAEERTPDTRVHQSSLMGGGSRLCVSVKL